MSTYTIPYVVQQTPRGERTLDLYSRLLSERIVYLGTEIDDGVANAVIAQLLHQPATQGRGTIPDLILEADEVARVRLELEEVLAQHTGRTPEQIRQDTDRTLVLPGAAAVDYGIVDTVLHDQVPATLTPSGR